ncbi:MAG TPA: sigma-70 family RNA polymerase sigma factor [Candidatus Anammoximicrobium sp.]|nr:sigma-70 family RNA polymerase sigma factor [Candidatus Anammoximicrobium sp.]
MTIALADADELCQLRSGREQAVAELFGRNREKLQRMIAFRLDSRIVGKVDGDDILQDAYLETVRRIQDYLDRPSVPFFVWLRQITTQVLIDTHRRYLDAQMRDVKREVALDRGGTSDTSSSGLIAQLADSLTTPSQCAVREETICELRQALDQLEEIDREVLVLRHLEELSNNEVAQVLGIDKYAASKRYLRALERLRGVMSLTVESTNDEQIAG